MIGGGRGRRRAAGRRCPGARRRGRGTARRGHREWGRRGRRVRAADRSQRSRRRRLSIVATTVRVCGGRAVRTSTRTVPGRGWTARPGHRRGADRGKRRAMTARARWRWRGRRPGSRLGARPCPRCFHGRRARPSCCARRPRPAGGRGASRAGRRAGWPAARCPPHGGDRAAPARRAGAAVMGIMGWSHTAMAARYQHVTRRSNAISRTGSAG